MGILLDFIHWLPTYFFPKICYGCGREGWFVCPDCRLKVTKAINSLICPMCRKPSPLGMTHHECRRPNGLDGLISYYRYSGWAKEIVKDAKFGLSPHWRAMKELAGEMALAISTGKSETRISKLETNSNNQNSKFKTVSDLEHSNFDNCFGFRISDFGFFQSSNRIVVPVPLHWWRKMKRGFNQAEIIAKPIAKSLNLPLRIDLIERSVYSQPQTLVGDKLRRTNVKKAFGVNSEFSIQNSKLNSVILVDDVWTSGATMKECCRTLKLAGVKKVWGITLLRA